MRSMTCSVGESHERDTQMRCLSEMPIPNAEGCLVLRLRRRYCLLRPLGCASCNARLSDSVRTLCDCGRLTLTQPVTHRCHAD